MVQIEMSNIVDTITSVFKTESNNAADVKGTMNTFARNANNKTYGTAAPAPKPESGFLNTITGLFQSKNDSAINVRAKMMAMNKNANNKAYGKNASNNGWFNTIKKAFKSTSKPLNPNAPEYIPQSTAAMIQQSAGRRHRRNLTRRRRN